MQPKDVEDAVEQWIESMGTGANAVSVHARTIGGRVGTLRPGADTPEGGLQSWEIGATLHFDDETPQTTCAHALGAIEQEAHARPVIGSQHLRMDWPEDQSVSADGPRARSTPPPHNAITVSVALRATELVSAA